MSNERENLQPSVEDALSILEKSIDVSRLHPVRTQIHMRDGRVYTKTIYKKLTEAPANIQAAYTNQREIEQRGSAAVGQRVHAYWKGESSGQTYNSDLLKVQSVGTDSITLEFIAPFATNNSNRYVYSAGSTITVPKTNNQTWSDTTRMDKWVAPVRVRPEAVATTTEITALNQVSVGDRLTVTPRDGSAPYEITVTQLTHEAARNYDFIKFRDASGALKWIKVGSRNVTVTKTSNEVPSMPAVAGAQVVATVLALKAEGYNIDMTMPFPMTQVTGREQVTERVRLDRYNQPTTRSAGSHWGNVTRYQNITRPLNADEIDQKMQEMGTDGAFDTETYKTLAKINFKEMIDGLKNEISGAGLRCTKSNIAIHISAGGGDMTLNVNTDDSKLEMTRNFNIANKSVYHALFKMDASSRGDSLGKKCFQQLYKQYKAAGIKKISVSANINVGCYAWAAYGFTATKASATTLINKVAAKVGQAVAVVKKDPVTGAKVNGTHTPTDEEVANMRTVLNQFYRTGGSDKRIPMHLITAVAKNACKAVWVSNRDSWQGEIDLTDASQRTYFENYISRV